MVDAIAGLVSRYPDLADCESDIIEAFLAMHRSYQAGGKLLVCGNGGSAADSLHMVGDLMKGFLQERRLSQSARQALVATLGSPGEFLADHLQESLPAIALIGEGALWSAIANDTDPHLVFAQQVYGYGKPGDVLLAISTSGKSPNVIRALQVARARQMVTVGLTGKSGGEMGQWCDICIRVPYESTPEIQERHLPIYHALCLRLEEVFFGS